jgi:hypothetical protein
MSTTFWARGTDKSSSELLNKVYFNDALHIYQTKVPTHVAYSMNKLLEGQRDLSKNQRFKLTSWVARWVGDRDGGSDERALQNFLRRRESYLPPRSQRVVHAREFFPMSDYRYRPGTYNTLFGELKNVSAWYADAGDTEILTLARTNFAQLFAHIDPETTFLYVKEHGSENHVGSLGIYELAKLRVSPPVVLSHSCFGGAWVQALTPGRSLLASMFNLEVPPLAFVSSQNGTAYAFTTPSLPWFPESYIGGWKVGQSLGQRQREAFAVNYNASVESKTLDGSQGDPWMILQVVAGTNIFGDGTVEW